MPARTSKFSRSRSTPCDTTAVPISPRMRSARGVALVSPWTVATTPASSPSGVSPIKYSARTRSDPAFIRSADSRWMSSRTAVPCALALT